MSECCGIIKDMKTAKQLERYFKGVANHRRLDILQIVNKRFKTNF